MANINESFNFKSPRSAIYPANIKKLMIVSISMILTFMSMIDLRCVLRKPNFVYEKDVDLSLEVTGKLISALVFAK